VKIQRWLHPQSSGRRLIISREAEGTSETSVNFDQTTQCYNTQDSHFHTSRPVELNLIKKWHLDWNSKVNYCFHNSLPLDPNLGQLKPVNILTSISLRATFILFFLLHLGFLSNLLTTIFQTKILYAAIIPHARYVSYPSHTPRFDSPNYIWWTLKINLWIKKPIT
jgi:hypothetical protein